VDNETLLFLLIVFGSTLTRSIFGFGEALIAMPLLSFLLDVKVAAPVVALIGLVNGTAILSTDLRSVQWADTRRLFLSAVIGVPIGVYALKHVPENAVKLVLATVVIAFSLYNLGTRRLWHLQSNRPAFLFGFSAGMLGGAYNTTGPPLIIFGTLRDWQAQQFRATIQSVLVPTSVFVVANHALAGFWNWRVFQLALFALPVILITAPLGGWINRKINGQSYRHLVFLLLLAIGAMLLIYSLPLG
jgi:uncharacterized membrane protein YfcA